ncbi:MAG: class I SAM-dependent methyltransferase [Planctomycetota bacterium]|nr:class I SAM-dependent methyltransferase [Planctomycetota bacterium]
MAKRSETESRTKKQRKSKDRKSKKEERAAKSKSKSKAKSKTESKDKAKSKDKAATKSSKKAEKKKKKKPLYTARTADKHVLYELAVQAPEREVKFLSRCYKKTTGEPLRVMREDFCGTAVMASWFVKLHKENRAIGIDLDQPTLDWGIRNNVEKLLDDEQKSRLSLINSDVCDVTEPKAQLIAALNFSYSVFQTRAAMLTYFKTCFDALEPGGMFFVDDWGGPDVIEEDHFDRTKHKGFTYVWEQRSWDPISNHIVCAIHFEFPDGTRMKNAFVYDWRLWSLPELQEIMQEVGFEDVHVLWEGSDKNGEGNGVFKRRERGEADDAWIVYVVGRKPGK